MYDALNNVCNSNSYLFETQYNRIVSVVNCRILAINNYYGLIRIITDILIFLKSVLRIYTD